MIWISRRTSYDSPDQLFAPECPDCGSPRFSARREPDSKFDPPRSRSNWFSPRTLSTTGINRIVITRCNKILDPGTKGVYRKLCTPVPWISFEQAGRVFVVAPGSIPGALDEQSTRTFSSTWTPALGSSADAARARLCGLPRRTATGNLSSPGSVFLDSVDHMYTRYADEYLWSPSAMLFRLR